MAHNHAGGCGTFSSHIAGNLGRNTSTGVCIYRDEFYAENVVPDAINLVVATRNPTAFPQPQIVTAKTRRPSPILRPRCCYRVAGRYPRPLANGETEDVEHDCSGDRKSTRLNSSH